MIGYKTEGGSVQMPIVTYQVNRLGLEDSTDYEYDVSVPSLGLDSFKITAINQTGRLA